MTAENAKRYHTRLLEVLEYIDAHLHEDLDHDRLSSVAAFSTYHFHRLRARIQETRWAVTD